MAFPGSILSCSRVAMGVLFVVILLMATERINGDPEALQDFCVADKKASIFINGRPCINPSEASAKDFTTSDLRNPGNLSANSFGVSSTAASSLNVPGLNTLGIIMLRADMAVGGVFPPHFHPRASEIVYIVQGTASFGFVDTTTNKLFNQTLEVGDVFVVPKGTVHYVQNIGKTNAFILVAFSSQNPGVVNVPSASFATTPGIPQEVLAKSFAITVEEADQIRKSLGGI